MTGYECWLQVVQVEPGCLVIQVNCTGKLLRCRAHGVSFYNPQLQDGWNECFIPHEVAMKEACRLLFFVITEDTRAVTSMLEVCSL